MRNLSWRWSTIVSRLQFGRVSSPILSLVSSRIDPNVDAIQIYPNPLSSRKMSFHAQLDGHSIHFARSAMGVWRIRQSRGHVPVGRRSRGWGFRYTSVSRRTMQLHVCLCPWSRNRGSFVYLSPVHSLLLFAMRSQRPKSRTGPSRQELFWSKRTIAARSGRAS